METLNVSLSVQIRLNSRPETILLVSDNQKVLALYRAKGKTSCVSVSETMAINDPDLVSLKTDLDDPKKFRIVGTGNLTETNIKTVFRMIRKYAKENKVV